MRKAILSVIAVVATVLVPHLAISGVYLATVDCIREDESGNFCVQGRDDQAKDIGAFAISHPPGWDGTQSVLEVTVCTSSSPSDAGLVEPTKRAVETWNNLSPTVANCPQCLLAEDPESVNFERPDVFHAESVILHELGHCAMGLDHPNLFFDDPEDDNCNNCDPEARVNTSFAMSYDGVKAGILKGSDGVRGSGDDEQLGLLGAIATNVHWFRIVDNNPAVVDGGLIDLNTYRRSVNELPNPDSWPAAANVATSLNLLEPGVQSVMYTPFSRATDFRGLSADDVNTVRMGATGEDRLIGGGDDYVISLVWVEDCLGADVQVAYEVLAEAQLGECPSGVLPTFASPAPPLARHYTVRGIAGARAELRLNSMKNWDEGPPFTVYVDGFETGDTSQWSATVP